MLSEFAVYLRLGFEHILDLNGWDHILFVVALTVPYTVREWRAVVIQITAFTVGHSLTLALATLDLVRVSTSWVEFLIPVTILATAIVQLRSARAKEEENGEPRAGGSTTWLLALGFGLVHGLGFSNFLRAALGAESSIVFPLFAFNVGLEAGQLIVVLGMLTLSSLLARIPSISRTARVGTFSTAIAIAALYLSVTRLPF